MKKNHIATLLATLITPFTLANFVQADTIFGVYAGAGSWETDYSGSLGDPALSTDDLGIDKKNNSFFYIAIEHPVPLIPNIKLQQNNITSRQTATINQAFTIGDTSFVASDTVSSDFDLSHTDATLYYEILDNWLNLDLGVTLRKFDGHAKASAINSQRSENVTIDDTVPLVYAKFQFDLPFSGFSAGFEGNYINYDGDTLADYNAKVGYLFDSALDLGIEVGYRQTTLKINDDDVNTDLKLSGPYAAAIFHF